MYGWVDGVEGDDPGDPEVSSPVPSRRYRHDIGQHRIETNLRDPIQQSFEIACNDSNFQKNRKWTDLS